MNTRIRNSEIVFRSQIAGVEKVVDKDLIEECRELNEVSARKYLDRFFYIEEFSFSQFRKTMRARFRSMPVEDVSRIPGVKYSNIKQLKPIDPTQVSDIVVAMIDVDIPESLGDVKCYSFALTDSVATFIRKYYYKSLKKLDLGEVERREAALRLEESRIEVISVFYPSSFLSFIRHQCPMIKRVIEDYEKLRNLEELQNLISSS